MRRSEQFFECPRKPKVRTNQGKPENDEADLKRGEMLKSELANVCALIAVLALEDRANLTGHVQTPHSLDSPNQMIP